MTCSEELTFNRKTLAEAIEECTEDGFETLRQEAMRDLGAGCRFISGANEFRCYGLDGTSTISWRMAMQSWARAVRKRHG